MQIVVVDGQGGSIGAQLSDQILTLCPNADVLVIGTNSVATSHMLKGKAKKGATGENPVLVAARNADIICGPMGIVLADAMLGEITAAMAQAISQSKATKILIPVAHSCVKIVGTEELSLTVLIEEAAKKVVELIK